MARKKLEPEIDAEQFDKLTNLKKDIEEGQATLQREKEEFYKERDAVKTAQDNKIKAEVVTMQEDSPKEELSKDMLLNKDVDERLKIDDDKDYCAKCHMRGKITELKKGKEYCPVCQAYLEW